MKNFHEEKRVRRLLVEGSVLDAAWRGSTEGFAFVLKSDVDVNTPWPLGTPP